MTESELLECTLNRYGQTLTDLPTEFSSENIKGAMESHADNGMCAEEYICYLAAIIDRMHTAMLNNAKYLPIVGKKIDNLHAGINQRIKERVETLGLSNKDLSRKSGVSIPTIIRLKKGEGKTQRDVLIAVCEAIGMDYNDLYVEAVHADRG